MSIDPFSIPSFEHEPESLRSRLRQTRWPDEVPDSGWQYGINQEFVKDICSYGIESYDWKVQASRLSAEENKAQVAHMNASST